MKVFLQALSEQVWQAVEVGWIKPKKAPIDQDEETIKAANFNSRALNALFCGVTACSLPSAGDRSNIILGVPRSNHKEQGKFKDNIIK